MIRCFPLESVYSRNEKIEETRKKQGDGVLCVLRAAFSAVDDEIRSLSDKHSVAEGEESILFFYRGVISVKNIFTPRKGAHKHNQR